MISNSDYGFLVALPITIEQYKAETIDKLRSASNIYSSTWLPQETLLSDSRIKLFLTHGGLNSYYESIKAKKPMVIVPFPQDEQAKFICDFAHLANFSSCVYTLNNYELS